MALFRITNGDGNSVVSGKIASLQIPRNGVSKQVGELYIVKDGVMRNALADAHLWRKYKLEMNTIKSYRPVAMRFNTTKSVGDVVVRYSKSYSFDRETGIFTLIAPIEGRFISDYYPVYTEYPYMQQYIESASRWSGVQKVEVITYSSGGGAPPGYYPSGEAYYSEEMEAIIPEPGELLGYVTSTDSNAYPDDRFDGDYWYAKIE